MMSPLLLQLFAFMLCTFAAGLLLGWVIWRFEGSSKKALNSLSSEVDFWRSNLEQSRIELANERTALAALREEKTNLKKRLASLEG